MTFTPTSDRVPLVGDKPDPAPVVPGLVCSQAASTPEAVAAESGGDRLTYSELLVRAAGLARCLRQAGVRPGELVAVAVPRGLDLLPALLGVHLAGAAFIPLDPRHPVQRLDHILGDAGARVLVTADATGCAELRAEQRVHLDEVPAGFDGAQWAMPGRSDPAYAIYTSGSTGRPKGVLVTHGAFADVAAWMRAETALGRATIVPTATTVSFDIALVELFVPLTTGARLLVAGDAEAADPARLRSLLERGGAQVMQATPTTWRLLLQAGWVPPPGFTVLCGGERLPADLAARLLRDDVVLHDLYGPTEATIWASTTRYRTGSPSRFSLVPRTAQHVLDDYLAPVAEGELYLEGAGLAVGYLRRAALTAQRFVAAPGGGRWYRTGDLAQRHPDGRIEILGRTDDQIKIRGFRVEPAEIEAALAGHPAVAEAAVRAFHDAEAPRLVGYLRAAGPDAPPQPAELRALLGRTLPAYMIPVQFVVLPDFPRTANGKLDRAALPAPQPAGAEVDGAADLTARVAAVLAGVLGHDQIEAHQDFFGAGGDSMLAVQAVHRVNADLGAALPINALFEERTAYGLAGLLRDGDEPEPPVVAAAAGTGRLSSTQWRLWRHQQVAPHSTAYNAPIAVRLPEPFDGPALEAALTGLFARHETLRTRYVPDASGRPAPVVAPAAVTLPPVEDGDPAAILAAELARPFDLGAAAPVRIRLAGGPSGHVLMLVVHEIAADEHSRALIAAQLSAACAGRAVAAPLLRAADHAQWQRDLMAGPAGARHLEFWRRTLDGLDPARLRTDRPRTADRDWRAGTVRFAITADVMGRLRDAVTAHGVTVSASLLTAFLVVLSRHADGTDLTTGVPVDGRSRPELAELVGPLTDTVVVRARIGDRPDFATLLGRVGAAVLAAVGRAAVPYEDIVMAGLEGAEATPDPARHPLFDTMFTVNGVASPAGVALPDSPGVRFDLCCRLVQRADGGLDGRLEYATQLFDATTIAGFAEDFTALVGRVPSHLE
ncbi:amino acid adenylation domain-containing protein [Actinoplanes sp. NPDC026670]|uniref:amino acid adenylation domain-containing protein n=1 Tax=Actinoplanes sp. NPDC026670 TaxID=3154700 RepID=UPI0033F94866